MTNAVITILILAVMLVCYITKLIPIAATSVLGALAIGFLGIMPMKDVMAQFVSDVVLLQIGVMIIGKAFFEVGLADDVGRFLSKHFANREKIFLIGIVMVAIMISPFLSNTATVALVIPIIASVEAASGGRLEKKNYYMAVGIASVLGGNLTLFGSTPQLAVQNLLLESDVAGVHPLGTFELVKVGLPLALLLPVFYLTVGDKLQKRVFDYTTEDKLAVKLDDTAKPLYKKILVLAIYLACIVCFVGQWIPIGVTAITGAVLCVALRCISEKNALYGVGWTTVIMLGGILGFSAGFSKSGAGQLIVDTVVGLFGQNHSPMLYYVIFVLVAVALTAVMSNTAVAVMLTPIAITMAVQTGGNPMTFVFGVLLAANISFCTPMATAPVTMTMDGGYRFSDFFKVGGAFTLVATAYALIAVPLICGI